MSIDEYEIVRFHKDKAIAVIHTGWFFKDVPLPDNTVTDSDSVTSTNPDDEPARYVFLSIHVVSDFVVGDGFDTCNFSLLM